MTTRTGLDLDPHGLGGVGDTARWMAASRARESRRPDRLFHDPYAEALAGPDGHLLLTHFHPRHANDDGNPFLPIRHRWFDDYLRECVAPGTQVVGLGAGLDTRAFRFDWPDGVVLYEVDQPAVLAYKRQRLTGAQDRCERHEVPVNLGDDWPDALTGAGFDPARPAVWFVEGVLFYLPEQLARRVLRDAARLAAPGSRIGLDLIGTGIFHFPYMREFLRRLEEADSPWVYGTDDPAAVLRECGWDDVVVTEPGWPGANFGRWRPEWSPAGDLPNLPRIFLVRAGRS
ncbi:SAM-dependent methyltransferase [Actinoallomurus sp. NPDC050550]|uniref:class I SAM-dependent methyltransferase n=1 Tax=Actinoallomurus sp. NPDC050550 TaxID=3154937 RepID=UPI0033F7AF69